MRDLGGKTAFVTCGASGIGFAMGQAFAAAGMKVMEPAPDPEPGTSAGARETAPLLPFEIYSANLGKLGLLDPHQVDAVILAYSTLKNLQAGSKPNESGPHRGYYLVQQEWIDKIYRAHGDVLRLIADATESLKERE